MGASYTSRANPYQQNVPGRDIFTTWWDNISIGCARQNMCTKLYRNVANACKMDLWWRARGIFSCSQLGFPGFPAIYNDEPPLKTTTENLDGALKAERVSTLWRVVRIAINSMQKATIVLKNWSMPFGFPPHIDRHQSTTCEQSLYSPCIFLVVKKLTTTRYHQQTIRQV